MNRGVLVQLGRRIFLKNFYLKFIAVILALALYIWVSEDRETVVAGYAPVQIVVPDEQTLVSDPVDRVKVTFRGRWSDINRFDPSQLDPIRIDLSPDDSVVSLTPNMIGVPPSIRITDIEPSSIYVELEAETYKNVPLRPRISGEPRTSYTVESTRVTPETITIRGPESRIDEIDTVRTEQVDISDRTDSLERTVQPDIGDGLISVELDEPIMLSVDIETEEVTETLDNISVSAVNTSYATEVEPSTAAVTIRGAKPDIDSLDLDVIRAEIDLTDEDDRPPGTFSRQAEVVNLPADVELDRIHPDRFRVTTERIDDGDVEPGGESEPESL